MASCGAPGRSSSNLTSLLKAKEVFIARWHMLRE